MKIEGIKSDDVLVSTDYEGTTFYKVIKVNRVTVDVLSENGNKVRKHPEHFDRRVSDKRQDITRDRLATI